MEATGKVSKTDAARRQLEMAIRLFFENMDHICAFALATASRRITDDLCKRAESDIIKREGQRLGGAAQVRLSYWPEMELQIKPEHWEEARKFLNRDQNFLKHADYDPDAYIEEMSRQKVALTIFTAVSNYKLLTQALTKPMSLFFTWFLYEFPNYVRSDSMDDFMQGLQRMRESSVEMTDAEVMSSFLEELRKASPDLFPCEPSPRIRRLAIKIPLSRYT